MLKVNDVNATETVCIVPAQDGWFVYDSVWGPPPDYGDYRKTPVIAWEITTSVSDPPVTRLRPITLAGVECGEDYEVVLCDPRGEYTTLEGRQFCNKTSAGMYCLLADKGGKENDDLFLPDGKRPVTAPSTQPEPQTVTLSVVSHDGGAS